MPSPASAAVRPAATRCPELLAGSTGESTGKGDNGYALFARLKQGFQPPPSKHAPKVMELAMQMAGPNFLSGGEAKMGESGDDDDLGGRVLEDPDDPDDPFSDFVPFMATLVMLSS